MGRRKALARILPSGPTVTTAINKDGATHRCGVVGAGSILSAAMSLIPDPEGVANGSPIPTVASKATIQSNATHYKQLDQ